MEELDSHWTEFHEILYLSAFRYYVEKINVLLKCDTSTLHEDLAPFMIMSR